MRIATVALASLALAGSAPGAGTPVLGIDWKHNTLAWFDPTTLHTLAGRKAALADHKCGWAFAPDRASVAIVGCDSGSLRIVDARRMTVSGDVTPERLYSWYDGIAWPRADRILAVADRLPVSDVLVVDPATREVVKTVPLGGSAFGVLPVGDKLVVLIGKHGGFRSARVAVVDADGGVRAAALSRIEIGNVVTQGKDNAPSSRVRVPGFTVDTAGGRALVVGATLTVAEVDLTTLAVTYHTLAQRTLQKSITGPQRVARWLGDGRFVIGGGDWKSTAKETTAKPIGLRVVDTRDWSSRTIDAQSLWFDVADGAIAVNGEGTNRPFTVYGPDGGVRWRTKLTQDHYIDIQAGNAYQCNGEFLERVLDVRTGATLYAPKSETRCARLLAEQSG